MHRPYERINGEKIESSTSHRVMVKCIKAEKNSQTTRHDEIPSYHWENDKSQQTRQDSPKTLKRGY